MDVKRRNFMKLVPLGILLPGQFIKAFSADITFITNQPPRANSASLTSELRLENIDELYKNAIVIDGLVISRGWDEDSFNDYLSMLHFPCKHGRWNYLAAGC